MQGKTWMREKSQEGCARKPTKSTRMMRAIREELSLKYWDNSDLEKKELGDVRKDWEKKLPKNPKLMKS
jgi:hypothetical protein